VPVIANIRPSGDTYLMEDFYYAGGMRGLMKTLADGGLLHLDAMTVSGQTVGQTLEGAEVYNDRRHPAAVQRHLRRRRAGGAQGQPGARWLRHQAQRRGAAPLQHTGPALVFDDYPSMKKAVDDPDLDVTPTTSWCCATPARRAAPACPSGACCPSPPSW
jgi:dihydroxyacid dehydratase/phosphogluconate dehydratase